LVVKDLLEYDCIGDMFIDIGSKNILGRVLWIGGSYNGYYSD